MLMFSDSSSTALHGSSSTAFLASISMEGQTMASAWRTNGNLATPLQRRRLRSCLRQAGDLHKATWPASQHMAHSRLTAFRSSTANTATAWSADPWPTTPARSTRLVLAVVVPQIRIGSNRVVAAPLCRRGSPQAEVECRRGSRPAALEQEQAEVCDCRVSSKRPADACRGRTRTKLLRAQR